MKSYACYVHVLGIETPHVRFFNSRGASALHRAVDSMVHEWPNLELIDVCDGGRDRLLARYTHDDCLRLLTRH